jgi:hypothetical protein
MMFIWLIVGVVLVSIAFFMPGMGPDLWPSLEAAGIATAVYLIVLTAFMARRPFPVKTRVAIWTVFLVGGVSLFAGWKTLDEESHWQKARLNEILGVIIRGVNTSYTHDTLVQILKSYYSPENKPGRSLAKIFLEKYPNCRDGKPIATAQHVDSRPEYDTLYMYPVVVTDTEIVLATSHKYAKGRDPAFKNVNGKTGMVQIRQTLTPKGMRYESDN